MSQNHKHPTPYELRALDASLPAAPLDALLDGPLLLHRLNGMNLVRLRNFLPALIAIVEERDKLLHAYNALKSAATGHPGCNDGACRAEKDEPEQEDSLAICSTCRKYLGWWCPESESNLCSYDSNGICKHCCEPEERK